MRNEDKKIWQSYTKSVERLKKRAFSPHAAANPEDDAALFDPSSSLKKTGSRTNPPDQKSIRTPLSEPRFDRKTERQLRKGEVQIEAKLDLHGMNQHEAHSALLAFLETQIKAKRRLLLIVTGKGSRGDGILRKRLADWLAASSCRPQILALRQAALKQGGAGAFYVILRRRGDKDDG